MLPDLSHYTNTDRPVTSEELNSSTQVPKKPTIWENTSDIDPETAQAAHELYGIYQASVHDEMEEIESMTVIQIGETRMQGKNFLTKAYGKMRNREGESAEQNIISIQLSQGNGADVITMTIFSDNSRNEWFSTVTNESGEYVEDLFDIMYSPEGPVFFYNRPPETVQTQIDGKYYDVSWDQNDVSEDKLTESEVVEGGLPLLIKYRTFEGAECTFRIPSKVSLQAEKRLLYFLNDPAILEYDFKEFDPYSELGFEMDMEPGLEDSIKI